MDVAWSELVNGAPMMANPSEYHTMMFEMFWHGNMPKERNDSSGKKASAKAVPKKALDELAALMEETGYNQRRQERMAQKQGLPAPSE